MHSIKSQIITAFENLDADTLKLLLDDNKTYQDVPKKIFVERYREYFQNLKDDGEVVCDFKAYPGKCNHCSKDKKRLLVCEFPKYLLGRTAFYGG